MLFSLGQTGLIFKRNKHSYYTSFRYNGRSKYLDFISLYFYRGYKEHVQHGLVDLLNE